MTGNEGLYKGTFDAYAQAQRVQNAGGVCPHCGSSLGHRSTCPLINREVAEARNVIAGELSTADSILLRGLGVIWSAVGKRILALALDKIAKDEAYENTRYENLQALASTLDEVLTVDKSEYNREPKEKRTSFYSYRGAGCSGVRVEVKANDHDVDLKIENLTMEQAQAILRMLDRKNYTTKCEDCCSNPKCCPGHTGAHEVNA